MARFRIEYSNPETGEPETQEVEFEDSPGFCSARDWAEDRAYTLADKGWYEITELAG